MTSPCGSPVTRPLGGAISGILDVPARLAAALTGALDTRGARSCEIPPPCWEPRLAGTCCLELTPGSTATIRVHVSNCGWSRQGFVVTAAGKLAGWLTLSPTSFLLGPQERATMRVTVHAPSGVKPGQTFSAPLLIRGCLDHFVRVEIAVTDCAVRNCCDIDVEDCPDHIHHWYDHFYCPRPCRQVAIRTAGELKNG